MSKAKDGGPAFPDGGQDDYTGGLRLRDYFAAKAMQGAIAEGSLRGIFNEISASQQSVEMSLEQVADAANYQLSRMVYRLADAMLAAREVKQ